MRQRFNFVALQLCFLLAVVYAGQMIYGFQPGFNASSSPLWKFFTSFLGHSDLEHLFNNLFFLGLFGSVYERFTSGKTFLATFLLSAVFANLSAFAFFPGSTLIGASGGAMGVLAALAVYRPRKIGLVLGVPAPMWTVLLGYLFINFAGLTAVSGVAHEAHLLGIISGGFLGYRLRDEDFLDDGEEGTEMSDEWKRRIREWEENWMK